MSFLSVVLASSTGRCLECLLVYPSIKLVDLSSSHCLSCLGSILSLTLSELPLIIQFSLPNEHVNKWMKLNFVVSLNFVIFVKFL